MQVEKERDRALESLVQALFGTVNTPVVAVTLRMIVKQAGEKAPQRQRGNPQVCLRLCSVFMTMNNALS